MSQRLPLLTLVVTAGAVLLHLHARAGAGMPALLYSRAAVADGELWRLLTGHLVHFSWPHLAADSGAFLLLGGLLEYAQGGATLARLLLVLALGTSAALWLFVPGLGFYGGISALNYGLFTWLCLAQRDVVPERWQRLAVLLPALLLAHVGWQCGADTSLLAAGLPPAVRVAWQAHLAGVALAFACAAAREGVRTWRLYLVSGARP